MKREAVIITAVPEAVKREGIVLPVYVERDGRRVSEPRNFRIHEGDMLFGLTYRARQTLYMRGMAVPVVFPEEQPKITRVHERRMKPKLTRVQREEKKKAQKSIFDFIP